MLEICGESIIKPLLLKYLEKGCFLNECKKANVVPVYKKTWQTVIKKLSTNISITNLR